MNSYFSSRDPDLCLEDMAYDVVWITPKQMHHLLSAKEIRDFLQEEMTARPERYYVDIVSIKSSPSAADISTVAYEINLVPKEEDKAVYLRCSMAICKRGQHFEITFIHMSEKQGVGGMEQIREFTENLPCGVLIFAYMKEEGPKTLFYNDYFWKKLHYKEDQFQKQMERDPFFMVPEEERDKIMNRLREIQGTSGHIAVNLTFFRRDGNRFQYRMIGAPAYQEGENTVYYCVFQETTGFNQMHAQMQERVAQASEILGKIPGALCVLTGEPGNWHPVYVTRHFPEQFGMTMAGFAEEVAKDPFYRLEMTSITRKRLTEAHIEMVSKDPYLGIFEMEMADGSKRWTDVYLLGGTDHTGKRMRMLFYVDRDEVKKAADLQIAKAEQTSKMQQERARVEIREAQEKARLEVEETRTTVRKEIEEAQAKTQEQIESFRLKMNQVLNSQKESAEDMEKKLRLEYDAREQEIKRSYADKEQMLEKQMENYRRAQESELAKQQRTIDLLTADCDRELQNKQKEVARIEEELKKTMDALRESEEIREQQRRSSELREKEQRSTVKRLQDMVESLQKSGVTAPAAGVSAPMAGMSAPGSGTGAAVTGTAAAGKAAGTSAEDSLAGARGQRTEPAAVSGIEDCWMDGLAGGSDGSVIRRGAVNRQSRMPFSSGLRPETASAASEPRRTEPIRRGFAPRQEEPVRRGFAPRQEEPAPVDAGPARSSVMDDLVQMAASDDGVLREELFSIDDCLENVMVLQEPVCAKKRIKLELKKSVSMPDQAIGDKAKLQRALVSLLESAIEQTPGGGVINLGCRADRASGNRAYMYFTIRDSGSSIASDLMQGMFEMKDEKDDPLRAGLYIAREIVSIMGGNVRVRSRRGEGTEFMVTVCMKLP